MKKNLQGILSGMMIIATMVLIATWVTPKDEVVVLMPNQIGWYEQIKLEETGVEYYNLMTPRGIEEVVGNYNLTSSISIYMDKNVYGLETNELSDKAKKRFRVAMAE